MAEAPGKVEIHRGLQGVHFDRSRVCFIDGRAGELLYRGYSIHDLATQSTFEETCYLLLYGELPVDQDDSERDQDIRLMASPLRHCQHELRTAVPPACTSPGATALDERPRTQH